MFSTEEFRDAMNSVVLHLAGLFYVVCVLAVCFNLAISNPGEPMQDAQLIAQTTALVSILTMIATVVFGALINAVSYGVQWLKETRN